MTSASMSMSMSKNKRKRPANRTNRRDKFGLRHSFGIRHLDFVIFSYIRAIRLPAVASAKAGVIRG